MAGPADTPVYRFGLFELDSRTGELRKQGLRLRVRGRPIEILSLLLSRGGEVVTRDELRQCLWAADTFVDFDHGLHSAVNRLRDALGDTAENPRFIETLPKRGYRFVAPVTRVDVTRPAVAVPVEPAPGAAPVPVAPRVAAVGASPEPTQPPALAPAATSAVERPAARSRAFPTIPVMLSAGLMVIVAVALSQVWAGRATPSDGAKMTIAVLPFANLSGDPDQEYLSDGFTEELIAELGMIEPQRLSVIGRTTSILYKDAKKSIGQIGKELGVTHLLEGSVRRSGDRVRVTAQLVETLSMANLWSETYERPIGDVLSVQTDVSQQIATSLALVLGRHEPPASAPPSAAAYELFMRGRYFREQASEDGARKAIEYYQRALAADPNYAAAHAGIADALRLLGAPGWEVEKPLPLLSAAKTAAERALALDPKSPQARGVLAMVRFNFDWDARGAEREIQEALRLNPSFAQAHQYYSGILTTQARHDEAIAAASRAVELDPLAPTATTSLGVRYYYANRPDEAIRQFQKTLEVAPTFAVAHWGLAQCYRLQGKFDDQITELLSAVQLSGSSSYMRAHLAYGYAVKGDRVRAIALRDEIAAEASRRYVAPYHLALIAAGLGETEEAVRWLERAYDDRSGWLMFLPVEPEFDGLRKDPGFQRLLTRIRPQS